MHGIMEREGKAWLETHPIEKKEPEKKELQINREEQKMMHKVEVQP